MTINKNITFYENGEVTDQFSYILTRNYMGSPNMVYQICVANNITWAANLDKTKLFIEDPEEFESTFIR
ncbi:hypothetical protein [Fulvivirga ligni]|uniref:hypothetical protein n=1 Tax=Fulvivirga ligni TaxID=2904246 RepID=UPI001F45FACB|nr:hypothetical protein [Fulvivirga ligni]UII19130.1 hypothetical protein LVD16_14895 [Fulvivirga ligni]